MKQIVAGVFLAACVGVQAQDAEEKPKVTVDDIRYFLETNRDELEDIAAALTKGGDKNSLFYFPTKDVPSTPTEWGIRYEDVNFASADGTKLHGWFLKAKRGTAKATIVFSHGNAGSIGHHLGFVSWLAEAGYQVLMFDYRGFGKSGGELDRSGMVQDVSAAFKYVVSRPDVAADKLISYGHSLGGAKSVTALAEGRPEGLKAIVIDGAFASYQAMALYVGGEFGAKLITDELSPKDYIAKISGTPMLVVHGQKDQVVPFKQGKELFDLANEPKTFFDVKEGRHGDSLSRDAGAYRKRMLAWLEEVM